MPIPNFAIRDLIPQYRDAGEAFQAFVCDLLKREYPGLEEYPALGKDGCIDFSHTDGNRRLVGDCKFMEDGDIESAQREWRKVEAKLREHLASPAGPTKGQSQYRPWYSVTPAIDTFCYCININLTNLNQVETLEEIIKGDFVQLADDFPHLGHLREIQVRVLYWQRLKDRLKVEPFINFSWFRDSNIPGLEPLDAPSQTRGFRAYLGNDKLPYYSIAQHKRVAPASDGSAIPGEEELLNFLESGHDPGVIVTGGGGLGKSRLSLQIARLAMERDWPVFRVRRISSDTVERLARTVGTASPALLVFDYVETQDDFSQIIEDMVQLNDMSGCRLRFVASCRSSFYKAAVKGRIRHIEVNLSKESAWLDDYRHAAVRHILDATGIRPDADHLRVCKGIPVLAVFMAYLREQGREDELHELIRTEDFGSWVVKRLDAAFGRTAGRDLATLVALFPMPKETVKRLDKERFERLFVILAEDGWIEEREWDELHDGPVWGTVHDVFADGVLLAHQRTVERTAGLFVADLLRTAAGLGVLRSALTSLQRVVFEAPLRQIDWLQLFSAEMAADPAPWRVAREMALRFAGLDPRQRILLLDRASAVWEGAEKEVPVQNALGWIVRCLVKEVIDLPDIEASILRGWLHKAAEQLTRSNYLLTWGIRLYPETLSNHALDWFRNHPSQFQTHYLLVAWLDNGLPVATVAEWMTRWSTRNATIPHFSFIASAWLDAGGAREVIEPYLRTWLDQEANRLSADAQFVYKSWLNATKHGEFVRKDVRGWLDQKANRLSTDAQFVYNSWLNATKDGEFVRQDVRGWLDQEANRLSTAAQFVYNSWLNATKDGEFVRKDVRGWLDQEANRLSADANFIYKSWLDATKDGEFVREDVRRWLKIPDNLASFEANYVIVSWLKAGMQPDFVLQAITDWLRNYAEHLEVDYVCRAWLEAKGDPEVVREPAINWLRLYHEKEEAGFVTKFLAKLPDLHFQAVLDILAWCRIHRGNPDALWRLTTVARHVIRVKTTTDFVLTCGVIIDHYTMQQHIDAEPSGQLDALISHLIGVSSRLPALNASIDALFVSWLRYPGSYGKKRALFDNVQRKSYLQRIVQLLKDGKIDMAADQEAIVRFLQWVNLWKPEKKAEIRATIYFLGKTFPEPSVWGLVTF